MSPIHNYTQGCWPWRNDAGKAPPPGPSAAASSIRPARLPTPPPCRLAHTRLTMPGSTQGPSSKAATAATRRGKAARPYRRLGEPTSRPPTSIAASFRPPYSRLLQGPLWQPSPRSPIAAFSKPPYDRLDQDPPVAAFFISPYSRHNSRRYVRRSLRLIPKPPRAASFKAPYSRHRGPPL